MYNRKKAECKEDTKIFENNILCQILLFLMPEPRSFWLVFNSLNLDILYQKYLNINILFKIIYIRVKALESKIHHILCAGNVFNIYKNKECIFKIQNIRTIFLYIIHNIIIYGKYQLFLGFIRNYISIKYNFFGI